MASLLERIGLGFSLCSLFLKNYSLVNIFSPPIIMAGGSFI
jgi:hypothetical protein